MSKEVYSVSEITRSIAEQLRYLGHISVVGELSSIKFHRSQHWYFDIKDEKSVLKCVMFRNRNRRLGWQPKVGDKIELMGQLSVYAPSGSYNLNVSEMKRAGVGDQLLRLEALKKKLLAEGIFDPARKRVLPRLPRSIGVATSAVGAAFQDICTVLYQRFPNLSVFLAPCTVQGSHAPASIVAAIELLNRHGKSDVLIVGRGGGSAEDLAAFNDERVIRAIANSSIPVICGVGHEVDYSLSDLAADRRAATPSNAAEIAVPVREELQFALADLRQQLLSRMQSTLRFKQEQLYRWQPKDPRHKVRENRLLCNQLYERLYRNILYQFESYQQRFEHNCAQLDALSPLSVLGRGYSVVSKQSGQVVVDSEQVRTGEKLQLRLQKGKVDVVVKKRHSRYEQTKLL